MADPAPVLHLRSSTDLAGPDRVLLDLAGALPSTGYRVVLGLLSDRRRPPPALADAAAARGLLLDDLPSRSPLDLRLIARVVRCARRCGAVAIHAHEPKGQVAAAAAARSAGLPLVITHHGWLSQSPRERIYEGAARRAMARASRVVAVSRSGAEEVRSRCGASVVTVPNGIDPSRTGPPAGDGRLLELGIDPGRPLIVGAGRLEPAKGFADLVDAVAGLEVTPAPVLAILGRGPAGQRLARRARQLGVELALPGYVEDVGAILGRARVFALASHREQCPVVVLEAMAAGCPVVATAVGGVPDLVGEAGLLVEPGSPGDLSGGLRRILDDPELARSLATAAGERVEGDHGAGAMARGYARVYGEVRRRTPRR